jgi:hypothetical protein
MAAGSTRPAFRDDSDWKAERERIDLAAVATSLMGPAAGRRGVRDGRLWWRCPFGTHDDDNPSFCVERGKKWWKCFGCGEHGHAVELVKRLKHMSFPEAKDFLLARTSSRPAGRVHVAATARPVPDPRPGTTGLSEVDIMHMVQGAEGRLWGPAGAQALDYLTGPRRLTPETIRRARLGWVSPGTEGVPWRAPGVLVPWFDGDHLVLAKVRTWDAWREDFQRRQPGGKVPPKYLQVFSDPARTHIFLGNGPIRPGRPLVVTEGEFDALVLGQALGDAATVVTLGSASARPGPRTLLKMLVAPEWYIATDADKAGETAANGWPGRARRVAPPWLYKDWTEAALGDVALDRWSRDVFAGIETPELYTTEEQARWHRDDDGPESGVIVVVRPDPERHMEAMRAALADPDDPEREAICWEASDIYNS